MAIIVPFVASAMGATALQATLVTVAFSVTGISAKIDKAASKVFGKDLVMLGNVLGAGYAMFNRGFDIGGGAESIGPATDTAGNLTSAPEISSSAWDAMGEANATAIESASAGMQPTNLADMAAGYDDGSFFSGNGAEFSPVTPDAAAASSEGTNMITLDKPGADSKLSVDKVKTAQLEQPAGATSQTAAAQSAAGSKVTAPGATKAIEAPSNIFDRLMYTVDKNGNKVFNDRLAGGIIQGVGAAAGGYMQSQEAAKGLDWQKQKYGARIGGRVTG